MSAIPEGWEAVIGLEVHAQLKTRAKLFSSAPNGFGGEPNTRTTEVDVGMPGVLPVVNAHAVELACRAALALGCAIQPISLFARKHYLYPDLPKGYQISQFDEPYALGGAVPIEFEGESREVPLERIHMEEDAAKNIHDDAITHGATHVDLNRAGVPLIEIVSEPAMHSSTEAGTYLRSLRSILRYIGATDADMEKGQFRFDANVSVRRKGETELGTKVEMKNINSFRFAEKAIDYEIERQIEAIEDGQTIVQETRGWDEVRGCSVAQRDKEGSADYRYFPDPDLPPLVIDSGLLARERESLPELPLAKRARYESEFALSADDARLLADDRDVARFFEETVAGGADAGIAANWIRRSLLEVLAETGEELSALPITPGHLVELIGLIEAAKVTASSARQIFAVCAKTGSRPTDVMVERGLEAVSDTGTLEAIAVEVIAKNASQVEQYRGGNTKVFNFFVGQVMAATRGKADPDAAREILTRLLAG